MSELVTDPPAAEPSPPSAPTPPLSTTQWQQLLLRRGFQLVAVLALSVVTMRVIAMFTLDSIWDDAYIFQRYSRNLLAGHGWAFNPGGEASYGTTSLLFVLPGTILRAITGNTSLSAILNSVVGGVVFLIVAALWARRAQGTHTTRATTLLLLLLWAAASEFSHHFVSGMDTTWVLAYLALYGWLLRRLRQATDPLAGRRRAIALGALGALSFAMRPDLVAFTIGMVALWWLLDRHARPQIAIALGLTLAGTGLQLGINQWHFGSALPLPFYAKSLGLYGGSLKYAYRGVTSEYLAQFLAAVWPMVTVISLDVLASPRRWWRQAHPQEKALHGATIVFGAYYWLLALPVMGFHQRFYVPLVVPLMWLTGLALARWQRRLHEADAPNIYRCARWAGAMGLTLASFWLWPFVASQGTACAQAILRRQLDFDVYRHATRSGPQSYWYKLDKVAQLPDDVVIAATEVGMLGAVNPHKRIIDIAGLNEQTFAMSTFDAEQLLNDYRPDLIYMPHRDYREMREALTHSPAFKNYRWFDMKRLHTKAFGVALRKDSRHFAAMSKLFSSSARNTKRLQIR